jgi:hypothetical protein
MRKSGRQRYFAGAASALTLKDFIESGGRPMIPLSSFIVNPALDSNVQIETDLEKLPKELGSTIIIPTADPALRREVDGRGFFAKESSATLILMFRQFLDGALYTGPWK